MGLQRIYGNAIVSQLTRSGPTCTPCRSVVQRLIHYVEQVTEAEQIRRYLALFDRSVSEIETTIRGANGDVADILRAGLARLRDLRAQRRVTFWHISGGLAYASYDPGSGQLRLHVNPEFRLAAFVPDRLVHESIHAVHAAAYPALSRMYGEALAAGGTADERLGVLLLKWKAWTEYWAYRRAVEYDNLQQTSDFRRDPDRTAREAPDVRRSVTRIRQETGEDFDPAGWTPPARVVPSHPSRAH